MDESAQITTLRAQIAEAKAALHKLMLGDKEVKVYFGVNRGTEWAATNPDKLSAYISGLESELSTLLGTRRRGPIYPRGGAR